MTVREHEDGELGLRTDLYELVDLGDVEHDCEPTEEDAQGISDNGLVRGRGCGHAWGLVPSEAGIALKPVTAVLRPGDVVCFHYREQRLMAKAIEYVTGSVFTHCGTYLGYDQVGEATGSGYRIGSLARYQAECVTIRVVPFPGDNEGRRRVVDFAIALVRTNLRYGWLDVAALGLAHYGIRPWPVLAQLRTMRTAFCSQACAKVWAWAGTDMQHLTGKPDYETTPGDLAKLPGSYDL